MTWTASQATLAANVQIARRGGTSGQSVGREDDEEDTDAPEDEAGRDVKDRQPQSRPGGLSVDRPRVFETTRRAFERIAEGLAAEAGAKQGQMMGMPTLYLGGKAFAGLFGEAMVFKLEGEAHAAALAHHGASLFDPSGMGRPMKAWVQVPAEGSSATESVGGR